jgi:hypothetical protein
VPCGISTLQLVIAGATRLRVMTCVRTKLAWPNTPIQSFSSYLPLAKNDQRSCGVDSIWST